MAFSIALVGLVNVYDRGRYGKLLLLPEGTTSNLNVPPHVANIVVLESQCSPEGNWEFDDDPLYERLGVRCFTIEEDVTLSISGLESGDGSSLDTSGWDGLVPLLREIDKDIHIDPDRAATIAQMPVSRGKLEAFFFGEDSVVGRLTVEHRAGEFVTITATPRAGDKPAKTLKLLDGAEIVITNISRRGSARPDPAKEEDDHFKLYGQLDVDRRNERLEEPKLNERLQHLPSGHPYLAYIRANGGAFPQAGCSVTGCCPG